MERRCRSRYFAVKTLSQARMGELDTGMVEFLRRWMSRDRWQDGSCDRPRTWCLDVSYGGTSRASHLSTGYSHLGVLCLGSELLRYREDEQMFARGCERGESGRGVDENHSWMW